MTDHVPAFSSLLREALASHLRPDAKTFVDMFAPDGVMEFPYGLPSFDKIVGRAVLAERLGKQGGLMTFIKMSQPVVYRADDAKTFIVEFVGTIEGVDTKEVSDQKLISVITIEQGLITHYKDYWNPLALLGTLKGEEWLNGVMKSAGF